MTGTNLNITGEGRTFNYIARMRRGDSLVQAPSYSIADDGSLCFFNDNTDNAVRKGNMWIPISGPGSREYTPAYTASSHIELLIPQSNITVYEAGVRYALTVSIWIAGHQVCLYSGIINPLDATACSCIERSLGNTYYESVTIHMIDPESLIYSDEWKAWREGICKEVPGTNNAGSCLNICLAAVSIIDNQYIPISGYNVCQSAMPISGAIRFLSAHITQEHFRTVMHLDYNSAYERSEEGLLEYLHETYGIEMPLSCRTSLIIADHDNIYKYIAHDKDEVLVEDEFTVDEIGFKTWDEYKDGMMISVIYTIYKESVDQPLLEFKSNAICLMPEIFSYMVNTSSTRNIDLSLVDMNVIDIHAVNKVVQNIVSVDRPDDYKANIQKPVFISSQKSSSITIHPSVIENISINLDAYKNKVDIFSIRIGDMSFKESGRIASGVIFRIDGSLIGKDLPSSGLYYILDNDGVMITSGKYTAI